MGEKIKNGKVRADIIKSSVENIKKSDSSEQIKNDEEAASLGKYSPCLSKAAAGDKRF